MRFIIPANLSDIRIEEVIERHHHALQYDFDKVFPDQRNEPTVQEVSDWLLMGRSIVPWVSTIGGVVRTALSKAAHELQVTLPARNCELFEELLTEKVVEHVQRESNVAGFKRITPNGNSLLIPFKHYGAAVGPRGQTIKKVFKNNAKLIWSTTPGYELDGVFEFWVLKEHWSQAQEVEAKNQYTSIEYQAQYT
ncbi:MAG: hypothetical protein CL678_11815 [Bdellovibrionaceae bacterium]|nr:hypothetical protein [Pseudobdellovibrionaceae bacterium]|tara:strand:- start:2499 stop:3080 length:582 start_codon:yes stop_codon:yes gene_type:complete